MPARSGEVEEAEAKKAEEEAAIAKMEEEMEKAQMVTTLNEEDFGGMDLDDIG